MADVGDFSTPEVRKPLPRGSDLSHPATGHGTSDTDQVGDSSQRGSTTGTPDVAKVLTNSSDSTAETADSSAITAGTLLSNQTFELWKAAGQNPPSSGKQTELTVTTLKAADGSAILSFNSDWFKETGDVDLAGVKSPKNLSKVKPGPPLDLTPPGIGDTTQKNRPKSYPDLPKEIPLPPRRPPQPETEIPKPFSRPIEKPKTPSRAVDATFLPERIPAKADQQTVVVLDDYKNTDLIVNAGKGFSHGELSARMAEENNFNVVRLQIGRYDNGHYNLPDALATLSKGIDDGSVKAGKGRIVNLSFDLAKTFTEASRMLGIKITPENLSEKRQEMLDIMRVKSVDKAHTPKADREFMRSVLAIDAGVKRLQEQGLTVVAAGGNAGKNSFNMAFLSADKQYSALTPDGKIAPWSADNSLTTPGLGEVDINALPVNAFDTTPISRQESTYRVAGTNIYLPAKEFLGEWSPATTNPDVLNLLMFNKATVSGGLTGFDKSNKTPPEISRFEGSAFTPIDAKAIGLPIQPTEFTDFNPCSWTVGTNVLNAKGTSFVNVYKLKELQKPH